MARPVLYGPSGRPIKSPSRKQAINPAWQNHFFHSASQDSKTPYLATRLDGIDELLPPYDWQTLLSASRGMYANFGPIRSAVFQKAQNAVGGAYLPDFVGADQGWGREARDWLINDWFPISDVRGAPFSFQKNLWLDSIATDRDGDIFYLLTEHPQSGLPATQHIPAHRVRTGHHDEEGKPIKKGPYRGARICNGVIKNRQGRTVAYRVQTGDNENPEDFKDISARDLRHIFDPEWTDQSRGICGAQHALRFVANSLQSHEWEHTALLMLSSIGLIQRNPLGMPDEDDPQNTLGEDSTAPTGSPGITQQTFEGGAVRYFSSNDPNAGLDTLNHERPSEQWERFQDRTIRLYCSAVWPYELIWKSDGVNGVTIRNIQERAQRFVRDRQGLLDPHARSQVTYALRKAVEMRLISEPTDQNDLFKWKFRHPKAISIDPGRDTRSEIDAIEANHTTLRSVVESRGSTIEEHFDSIIADELLWNEKRGAAGLSAPPNDTQDQDEDQ